MINLNEKLEHLKGLNEWRASDLELIKNWQEQINLLDVNRTYLDLPISRSLASISKNLIETVEKELITNRLLTDRERDYKFALKDVAQIVYNNFSIEGLEKSERNLGQELDEEIIKFENIKSNNHVIL